MAQISTNEIKGGTKLEIDGEPYSVVSNEYFQPGKGQPVNRLKIKNLKTGRVVEKTFKSGEKLTLADVAEVKMRMLYKEADGAVFMDDTSYEQITIPFSMIGDNEQWLQEDTLYDIILYQGQPIDLSPPIFMEMTIADTAPGLRGDSSGRVMKDAVTETGAKIKVPIFIEQGTKIKIDTRTGQYVSRI